MQERTTPVNGDKNSKDGSSDGNWIEDILTKTAQTVYSAALVPTDGASDHWGWISAVVDFDTTSTVSPANSAFWAGRDLTYAEGETVKPVLFANQPTQNLQALEDVEGYANVATRNGVDRDDNTNTMIFFMVMYHQSPARALEVLKDAGAGSNLNRIYDFCLSNSVLGQYKTRYRTSRDMIAAGDNSGIDIGGPIGTPTPDRPSDPSNGQNDSELVALRLVGEKIHLLYADGTNLITTPTPSGADWQVPAGTTTVVDPQPDLPTDPPDPTDPPTSDKGTLLVNWMKAHIGKYKYSQSAGRLEPDTSGHSDCSGCTWYCYKKVLGINIGTDCGAQRKTGRVITSDREKIRAGIGLQAGDLIHYWHPNYRHVEMYMGDGTTRTMGLVPSDDPGPKIHNMTPRLDLDGPIKVQARRYI